jgi:hypothetical protein
MSVVDFRPQPNSSLQLKHHLKYFWVKIFSLFRLKKSFIKFCCFMSMKLSSHPMKEHRLSCRESLPNAVELTTGSRALHNEELHNLYPSPNIKKTHGHTPVRSLLFVCFWTYLCLIEFRYSSL